MRVVVDTNILVSGVLARRGNEARVLNLAFNRKFTWLVSGPIIEEYEDVLHRREFKLSAEEVRTVLTAIDRIGERLFRPARSRSRRTRTTIDFWNAPRRAPRTTW